MNINKNMRSLTFAIDFDGTCVTDSFPYVGDEIGATPVLRELVGNGHRLILCTMRCDHDFEPNTSDERITNISGEFLYDAIQWFKERKIPLYGIQKDPYQEEWTSSPKCFADYIIDDRCLGIPLTESVYGVKHVDWNRVRQILVEKKILK